ncbi:hypothetical protein BDP27DRAFT_1244790 [Rhodocollybia butyracea]|uniref:Uncharacterized protein n=1 Tax=Rhodocollybia butyracea TaxID=206335 RepID=A0A9P5P5E8_9AGAR|nr:hypothetical protein BDP27DRAFT_1244790 [Rhodocollybia butyracea]
MSLTHKVDSLLSNVHSRLRLPRRSNRRGTYDTIASGYSHGQGQIHPTNFSISAHNQPIVEEILQSREVQQVARFVDQGLQSYFPKVHRLLTNLTRILQNTPGLQLKHNFPGSCFAASQYNFTNAATGNHIDFMNGFFLCCAIWNGGKFNPKLGGHLILWSLGIVVEFPPGASIIVPSASVVHGNIPIQSDEHRHSVTFFTAAGILRWYFNNFMNDNEFVAKASPSELAAWRAYKQDLWKLGMKMLCDE